MTTVRSSQVRSLGRFVFVSKFLKESSDKGMVFFASFQEFSGIFATQVGDPLAHHQEGRAHAASFDGVSTASRPAVSEAENEEVADFRFRVHHFPQGWVDLEVVAEFGPEFEDSVALFRRFGCVDCGGERQRSAKVSEEIHCSGTSNSVQGFSCG